jgi:hypothetical protein
MKQASFLIDNKKVEKLSIDLTKNDSTNITSKKPIKLVENIYYFTSSIPNSKNM